MPSRPRAGDERLDVVTTATLQRTLSVPVTTWRAMTPSGLRGTASYRATTQLTICRSFPREAWPRTVRG